MPEWVDLKDEEWERRRTGHPRQSPTGARKQAGLSPLPSLEFSACTAATVLKFFIMLSEGVGFEEGLCNFILLWACHYRPSPGSYRMTRCCWGLGRDVGEAEMTSEEGRGYIPEVPTHIQGGQVLSQKGKDLRGREVARRVPHKDFPGRWAEVSLHGV